MERRLTAILAADVVGYSRLMGEDEAGTLATLKANRNELIDPKTAQYHGRTIKLMGDGALMEFASVVDAVTFSVEVQGPAMAPAAKVRRRPLEASTNPPPSTWSFRCAAQIPPGSASPSNRAATFTPSP